MVISTPALLLWALLLLTLPLNWLLSAVVAAALHELSHFLAALALGGRCTRLRLSPLGAKLDITGLSPVGEALCALAGPLGGSALVLLWPRFPRLALCAGVQTLFNLLPVWPLDGGRALVCALSLLPNQRPWLWLLRLLGLATVAAVWFFLGIAPAAVLLFAVYRKFPCKVPRPGVQ